MTPRRFRWSRLHRLLYFDPTGLVEVVVAFCFVMLPGVCLGLRFTEVPDLTGYYLATLSFSEERMGWVAIVLGLGQLWGAGTAWYAARALLASAVAASCGVVLLAYASTGYLDRPTVPMLAGVVIAELFLAWRCWHERPDPDPGGAAHAVHN